ncbi:MAG: hypothetical protein EA367_06590 [Leptolyngbya sp. DLM2.Bin15]|nr:MAG: hypothetical protein EA367_06590 [Leptolyngbya sp. DLM2.Bin15]
MTRIAVNTGIKFAIVFILGFGVLGYDPILTLLLGAIGGAAGGLTGAWWQTKDTQLPPPDSDHLSPLARAQKRLSQWRKERRRSNKQSRYQRTPRKKQAAPRSKYPKPGSR